MNQSQNLRIRKHFSVVVHNPDLVEIKSGVWNVLSHLLEDEGKSGKLFLIVKALQQGVQSCAEIAKQEKVDRSVVEGVVDQLLQLGAIEEGSSSALDHYLEENAFLFNEERKKNNRLGKPLLFLGKNRLAQEMKRILVESSSQEVEMEEIDPLEEFHIEIDRQENGLELEKIVARFEKWKEYVWVSVQETIHPLVQNWINRVAFALGVSWLHVAIDGPFLFVGPFFEANEGPCYQCLETRVMMNLKEKESYQSYKVALAKSSVEVKKANPFFAISSLAASLATIELLNFLLTRKTSCLRKVLSIYLPTMEIAYHPVLQLSGCAVCSTIHAKEKKQLYFDIESLISMNQKNQGRD